MNIEREYKFRVWDADNLAFAYFDRLVFLRGNLSKVLDGKTRLEGQLHARTDGYYKTGERKDVVAFPRFVTNKVIQQYTGLKDKNGKDIYEGDIIDEERFDEMNGPKRGIIKWWFSSYQMFPWPIFRRYFNYPGHKYHLQIFDQPFMDFSQRPMTVIGNWFETPDIPVLEKTPGDSKYYGFENYYREFPDMIPKEITKEQHEKNVKNERLQIYI